MAEQGEFRFEIQDLTPWTLSMRRLQDYLPHLVEIFGNEEDVHLLRIDEGSAVPCVYAKDRAITRVQRRLMRIKAGNGSRKAYRAVDEVNELLAEDHTSAVLKSPYFGVLIEFPGNKLAKDPLIGPVSEHGVLQGELFQIGGRDETISVHIRNEGEIFICTATRAQGRDISEHLFRHVRVIGTGRWIRRETGKWKLVSFTLDNFMPLESPDLTRAFEDIRALGKHLGLHDRPLPAITDED